MLNKIIHYSLHNRVAILIITGVLLIAGCFALIRSDVDIFPDLNAPTVVVMTEAPGMAAEEVERMISYPIETVLNGAADVRRVRSKSTSGFSVVWVEFDWGTDIYRARQIVSEKLAGVTQSLPPGAGMPVLGPQSSILGEMMIIGLTADSTSLLQLRTIADREIAPRLLALGGVSQVSVIGGDVAQYQIHLHPEKMKYYGVSLDEVRQAAANLNTNQSGGVIYDFGNEYMVKAALHTTSVSDLQQAVVTSRNGVPVTLGDLADIVIAAEQPRLGAASVATYPAVLLTVTKQPAVGTIDLTERIDTTLAELSRTLPADVKVSTDIFRQSDFISNSISNLQVSLFEGAIFVIVVLFFFLMNFRTTLISVVALPVSVILTVLILKWLNLTINTMTLGGIAIAIGSLVDDAIVDVENVYRRLRQNAARSADTRLSTLKVVYEASREVRLPILNSSLIIIASFTPLFFLHGIEGRMLVPLGLTFIISLISSTVVALTLTPVLCSFLLGGKSMARISATSAREPWIVRHLSRAYAKSLPKALHHKKTILTATAILFIVAIGGLFTLGRSFLPAFNEGSMTINVGTVPGVSLEESDRIGRAAEEIILATPEVKTVARKTGRAELDEHSLGVNMSEIEAPYELSDRSRREMVRDLRQRLSKLPGVMVEIGQPISHRIDAMLSGTEAQIAIKIFGDDIDKLYHLGSKIKGIISGIPGIVDANIEQQLPRPEIEIKPRRGMLARYGITNDAFAQYVSAMLAGDKVSAVYRDGVPFDIVLIAERRDSLRMADLGNMLIDTPDGKIPLAEIAEINSTSGPNSISRENVKRRIVVSANIDGSDLRGAVNNIRHRIDEDITLPEGYYIQYGGQFESEASASRTLALASLGAVLLILLLLYHEYRNMPQALIILANMPLAIIGGVIILILTGSELNIPAIIGFISLMGIATRNGMLLMSRYNALGQQGIALDERIRIGSSDRLNPIVMTALTSALALIPLALRSSEAGNEIQSPMATVILGGLVSSTVLNLYIVPILYRWYCTKFQKHRVQ